MIFVDGSEIRHSPFEEKVVYPIYLSTRFYRSHVVSRISEPSTVSGKSQGISKWKLWFNSWSEVSEVHNNLFADISGVLLSFHPAANDCFTARSLCQALWVMWRVSPSRLTDRCWIFPVEVHWWAFPSSQWTLWGASVDYSWYWILIWYMISHDINSKCNDTIFAAVCSRLLQYNYAMSIWCPMVRYLMTWYFIT